jgi:hypothetical protein
MILPASQHFTKLVVSSEHIRLHHAEPQLLTASLRETLDTKNKERGEDSNSSMPNLLQIQGTSNTTAHR